jgi:hypothetical protein
VLEVLIYSYESSTKTFSYLHIPGSPFTLKITERYAKLLCEYTDLLSAGFGLTPYSHIVAQPQVVTAG